MAYARPPVRSEHAATSVQKRTERLLLTRYRREIPYAGLEGVLGLDTAPRGAGKHQATHDDCRTATVLGVDVVGANGESFYDRYPVCTGRGPTVVVRRTIVT